MIDKVVRRVVYDLAINANGIISQECVSEVQREFPKIGQLRYLISNLAKLEVGENIPSELFEDVNTYLKNGSFDENVRDLKAAKQMYEKIKYEYLIKSANEFSKQFNYFENYEDREDIPMVADKYARFREKEDLIERIRKKLSSEIEICKRKMNYVENAYVIEQIEKETEILIKCRSLHKLPYINKMFWDNFIEKGSVSEKEKAVEQYYELHRIIDDVLNVNWGERIQVLENVKFKMENFKNDLLQSNRTKRFKQDLYSSGQLDQGLLLDFVKKNISKVESDIVLCKKIQEELDIEKACMEEGFKRSMTPGICNNCVLESITKTISSANGLEKEDPRKAYEHVAEWQKILRNVAVELGFRKEEGFTLEADDKLNTLLSQELTRIKNPNFDIEKNINFTRLLRLNLDKNILNVWEYNYDRKKLDPPVVIKGLNAEKKGVSPVRMDILFLSDHAEPMYLMESDKFSSDNEFDESMDFDNVYNPVTDEDPASAYSNPARVDAIAAASDKAGFARGYAPGEGNNCFIQSLLQGIHYVNNTKATDPQKSREEAATWEQILRDEAVVNGFERNGHLGVTYGKEDQIPANSPYNLHKTVGTADNNFRQQLRLNLDNHVLTIYRYNEVTGKLEAADIVKGVNAGKNGKSIEIDMLYDRNHFDPLFAKRNKSDPKSAENMKEILNSTLRKFIRALDVGRNSETVIDDKMYRGGTDQRRINSAEKRYSTSSGNKKRDRRDDVIYENRFDDKKRDRRDDAIYENRLDNNKRYRRDDAINDTRFDNKKRDRRDDAINDKRLDNNKRHRTDDAINNNRPNNKKPSLFDKEAEIDEVCEKEGFDRVRLTITPDEKSEAVSTAMGAEFADGVDHRNDLKTFENNLLSKNTEERLSTEKRIITWCIALSTRELIVASVHYEPARIRNKKLYSDSFVNDLHR